MFNLAIDSKLRGCDVVSLKVEDVAPRGYAVDLATVRQRKFATTLHAGEWVIAGLLQPMRPAWRVAPSSLRRRRFMDGKTTQIIAGFDFVPLQQARGRLRRSEPVRELIGLHAQNLIRAKQSRDEPLFDDRHAAEDRH
jgi:hypothetical protein